ncbi:MAG: SRPBCC family protein [Acidimicrobiales bacterium]
MTAVTATIEASRPEVWDALVDVRTYPTWLLGARRIRHVDAAWPAPGSAFHHVVGVGPVLTISDRTSSVAVEPERRLELEVRARPLIRATVVFELRDTPEGTEVTLEEHPTGAHRLLAPLVAPLTLARNRASLARLEDRVRERDRRS